MSVYDATIPSTASVSSTSRPLVHIRTDPYAGRKYHASTTLSANTDLLGACTPYSYTIWKRFRNEVCAECWRYDRGRRAFLTRRDDEGLEDLSHETAAQRPGASEKAKGASAVGAGLWFCNQDCQQRWIAREGPEAVGMLRLLEGARQKKTKAQPKADTGAETREDREISQEVADRAWESVRECESSPKEIRKWSSIQLDDYETDMARYVVLALLQYHHERLNGHRACSYKTCRSSDKPCEHCGGGSSAEEDRERYAGGLEESLGWRTFASLQTNELSLLRACPEILDYQTRIYQLLKGRLGTNPAAHAATRNPSRSVPLTALAPTSIDDSADDLARGDSQRDNVGVKGAEPNFGDIVTIANVRRIFGVDPGNSFGIWEVPLMEESECLGFAVYPIASFFNHHCSPNVRKEREGRRLRFMTTGCVGEDEELCISYGHVERMSRVERQKELLEGWYFGCRCGRCVAEEEKPEEKREWN